MDSRSYEYWEVPWSAVLQAGKIRKTGGVVKSESIALRTGALISQFGSKSPRTRSADLVGQDETNVSVQRKQMPPASIFLFSSGLQSIGSRPS